MKTKIYYILSGLLLLTGIEVNAQSKFDVKKRKETKIEKPKSLKSAKTIDGRKNTTNFRLAPKGNVKNNIKEQMEKNRLNKPFKNVRIHHLSKETGLPSFISTTPNNNSSKFGQGYNQREANSYYLEQLASTLRIAKPNDVFKVTKIDTESDGSSHVRMNQTYQGHEIYGAEIITHFDPSGNGKALNGNYHLIENKDFTINISSQSAIDAVINDLSSKTKFNSIPEFHKNLLEYDGPEVHDTVIYQTKNLLKDFRLAYHVHVRPNVLEHWEYFVDVETGKILEGYKTTCHADGPKTATATDLNGVSRTINTFQYGSLYYMINATKTFETDTDTIITLDANFTYGNNFTVKHITSSNNSWNNPKAISAHHNASVAFDYYKNVHNRNSIDNKGGSIYSIINVVDDDGTGLDNAYWNGKAMFYGNGKNAFKPLAGATDVAGHEMTHGVVQNTANLVYQGEPGAINESMADIFGCMMDSSDWLMGEDVTLTSYIASGALRSLQDPNNGGTKFADPGYQPKHYIDRYQGTQDNGGVHINSGIPNYAFYLYATALNSRHKASKVFYRALSIYLTKSSKFIDLRLAVINAAKDLYGDSSSPVIEAGKAFDAVGIVNGQGTSTNNNLPTNPGEENLLCYNTDPNSSDGFYLTPNGQIFTQLTSNGAYNKPSITDDGNYAVYVNSDRKIRGIDLVADDQGNYNQYYYANLENMDWSNVAIAKDGSKLAAISAYEDTTIYIYDFDSKAFGGFTLYNPTFSDGVKSGGPIYADGLDWDYTGEFIVYDCFNTVKNLDGTDLEYWDINIINVWEKTTNNFGTGEVFKLISDLAPGESIGNAVFSKTSNDILAFDYEYVESPTVSHYREIGINLEKNDLKVIAYNNYLGWPSFNKTDTKLAFTTIDNGYNIDYVNLNADKISSNDSLLPSPYISGARWGVFYAAGQRVVSVQDMVVNQSISSFQVFPNPARETIYLPENISSDIVEVYDKLGRKISELLVLDHKIHIGALPSDLYILKCKSNDQQYTTKFLKVD